MGKEIVHDLSGPHARFIRERFRQIILLIGLGIILFVLGDSAAVAIVIPALILFLYCEGFRGRAMFYCLSRSRFSVVILFVGLGLLFSDQGQDAIVGVAEDGLEITWFAILSLLWALSIWWWCCLLLDIRFDEPPLDTKKYNFWRKWMPRILGMVAMGVVMAASISAEKQLLSGLIFGMLVLFIVIVSWGRDAQNLIARRLQQSERAIGKGWGKWLEAEEIGSESAPPYKDFWQAIGVSGWRDIFMVNGWTSATWVAMVSFGLFCPGCWWVHCQKSLPLLNRQPLLAPVFVYQAQIIVSCWVFGV